MSSDPPEIEDQDGSRAPWADGSVPLRGHAEEAERERRLAIIASRRNGGRRARVAAVGGLGVLLGGAALIATSLSGGPHRLSGAVDLNRGGVGAIAQAQRSDVAEAVALTTSGRARLRRLPERDRGGDAAEDPAAAPMPEPTYSAPEEAPPAPEPAPATEEPASPPADASGEFGFEH